MRSCPRSSRPDCPCTLYTVHRTSEQFHSEFKTNLNIERRPSGKFAANTLVLDCAMLTYNVLRWIGQNELTGPLARCVIVPRDNVSEP